MMKDLRALERKVRILQAEIRWLKSLADEPDELGAAAHKIAAFEAQLAEARAAERERCAKICDVASDTVSVGHHPERVAGYSYACKRMAEAIRALGDPPSTPSQE